MRKYVILLLKMFCFVFGSEKNEYVYSGVGYTEAEDLLCMFIRQFILRIWLNFNLSCGFLFFQLFIVLLSILYDTQHILVVNVERYISNKKVIDVHVNTVKNRKI